MNRMIPRLLSGVLALSLAGLPLAGTDGAAIRKKKRPKTAAPELRFKKFPSLRFGDVARLDFRFRVQSDFRGFSPASADQSMFDLSRARVSLQGNVVKKVEFEIERELSPTKRPWRDVYVNFRPFRALQLQAGRFKQPFGMEQLTSPSKLDFAFRSLLSEQVAPGRARGAMLHGRLFERGLSYQAGVFAGDGDNTRLDKAAWQGPTLAGRITGTPLRLVPAPSFLRGIELGGAFTTGHIREGLYGWRGRTLAEENYFSRLYVQGQRLRLGAEMNWSSGPFSVKSELVHARDERRGQGLRGDDLPGLIARGWYLAGTWLLTGEEKTGAVQPRRNFLSEGGFGALEVAGRYEQLRFGSSSSPGRPSRAPRAAAILGNSDRVFTAGLNWYLNHFVKVQVNVAREQIEDLQRGPGRWVRVCRLQFTM